MVNVLNFMEDEKTFNNLSFMKNKLIWNHLTTHLNICVHIFWFDKFSIWLCNFELEEVQGEVSSRIVKQVHRFDFLLVQHIVITTICFFTSVHFNMKTKLQTY
jgi:hypothetical protein